MALPTKPVMKLAFDQIGSAVTITNRGTASAKVYWRDELGRRIGDEIEIAPGETINAQVTAGA